jgi:hypothetical protein
VAAVSTVYQLAGTTAICTPSPLERYFRDAHTATKHVTLSSSHFDMVGQYLLGGGLQMRRSPWRRDRRVQHFPLQAFP